ncbi:MAG: hypothetical protein ABR861_14430 [Terriglobales bacterium]
MSSLEIKQLAMGLCAAVEILFLYRLAREVNEKLEQQDNRLITRREYGWGFFSRILKEHERLFPDSSERTWWVLIFVISVIGFIVADFL